MLKEIWTDIKGYEGIYQVSSMGKVKNNLKVLKSTIVNTGYAHINLCKNGYKKMYTVHRLVAQAFLGLDITDTKMCACHKNDIRDDNRAENLFLGTYRDNIIDMMQKGRDNRISIRGERHYRAKLTEAKIYKIKQLLKDGIKQTVIATKFNVSRETIKRIKANKTWKHLNN